MLIAKLMIRPGITIKEKQSNLDNIINANKHIKKNKNLILISFLILFSPK